MVSIWVRIWLVVHRFGEPARAFCKSRCARESLTLHYVRAGDGCGQCVHAVRGVYNCVQSGSENEPCAPPSDRTRERETFSIGAEITARAPFAASAILTIGRQSKCVCMQMSAYHNKKTHCAHCPAQAARSPRGLLDMREQELLGLMYSESDG